MKPRPTRTPRMTEPGLPLLGCVTLVLAACGPTPPPQPNSVHVQEDVQREADRMYVQEPFEDQVRQGVIRQKTIFENQFRADSAELTTIGRRNVRILAKAMGESGGRIAVPRGSATATLYAARLDAVRAALSEDGITRDRVQVGDGTPGGPGMATVEAIRIRENADRKPMQQSGGQTLNPFGDGKMVGGNS